MSARTVARRYATALYEEASDQGVVDTVDDDVAMLRESLASVDALQRLYESPVVSQEKKHAVTGALLEDRVHALTLRFVRLLITNDREGMLAAILQQYHALRDEQEGIVEVEARSAQPLDDDARATLLEALESKTGQQVRLTVRHDPGLMGGLVVRIGDRVFDGSIKHKLAALRERFRHTTATPSANGATAQ
ncbi:ATP synthase F1 subunit delta [Salisaeta longa]|uniref:ATP synthase F1 subunit delta n=1 Tax=Salisaeta longa TaxID=503170 RepID=UPI0003B35F61|nr:ATP synthase F1 subunit delta [Salisaeta longa]